MKQIERIREMERCLDVTEQSINQMSYALDIYEQNQKSLKRLFDYYGSSNWMRDFEADEQGKLPNDLKRGVLSEDAVYDLITEHHELMLRISRVLAASIQNQTI